MAIQLGPRAKRNFWRIIPFGLIWLMVGWLDLFIDAAATGNQNLNPSSDISLTFEVVIFASLAVTLVGLLVGTIEVFWLGKLFIHKSFWKKIVYKVGFYSVFLLMIILITYPIAAALELGISVLDDIVWDKFSNFLGSLGFISALVTMSFSLFLCFFYAGISDNLGQKVLLNFFTGKYHSPKEEERIFMFLDMKSSTALAEELGHIRYFELLRDYYNDLSDAIIDHSGEVYQYVGDEVVISWELVTGTRNNNCIQCFFSMQKALRERESYYMKKYGATPSFKAGIHCGKVTTGEIGALKKEIFFTGDVLNVTARIQGMCNDYGETLLISGELLKVLDNKGFTAKSLGNIGLKGRAKPLELNAIRVVDNG
ncbi:MAG: adenylate/guanylate cyclase domain-containing protein [Flavobacteriaceae bacterium]